ncbi:MAG: trehalase family glycosidase [Proteobacteria bacterium]|nr:trehalase family glycosidase [Pseudomonadota bacterium]
MFRLIRRLALFFSVFFLQFEIPDLPFWFCPVLPPPLAASSQGISGGGLPSAWAGSQDRPQDLSQVEIEGYPLYLEDLEVASPLSDFGSHAGLKASVLDDGSDPSTRIDHNNFMNMAHYAAWTDFADQLDQSFFFFTQGGTAPVLLAPADWRKIKFYPWGWEETACAGSRPAGNLSCDVLAEGSVVTLDTDVFLVQLRLHNLSAQNLSLAPGLTLQRDSDQFSEASIPLRDQSAAAVASFDGQDLVISRHSTRGSVFRVIRSSFGRQLASDPGIYRFQLRGINFLLPAGIRGTAWVEGNPVAIPGVEMREFYWVVGFGLAEAEARDAADRGWDMVAENPRRAQTEKIQEWEERLSEIRNPHTENGRFLQIYRLAATALRMNLYSPRANMPAWGSVPGKVHFNHFFGWDTPLQALGQGELNWEEARDNLLLQFAGLGQDGQVPTMMTDKMESNLSFGSSQPPVQGFVISESFPDLRAEGKESRTLRKLYEGSKPYLDFWRKRDQDGDGLPEYKDALETGWDDTPRYECPLLGTNLCYQARRDIDAVDLASWIYRYYLAMAEIAGIFGEEKEAGVYQAEARDLAGRIENLMWDPSRSGYFDLQDEGNGTHGFGRALTPALAWPLFLGVTRDPDRAREVIETHLLNPEEFWGDPARSRFPVPSVAFNDSTYYDLVQDGYYWQGQIWMIPVYVVMTSLFRYGYAEEAELLKTRVLEMMFNADPGGIHETYNARTGKVGWGSSGPGEPSVFQFGWSSALSLEILLDRYQRERFIRPGESEISGYIGEATLIPENQVILSIYTGQRDLPRIDFREETGRDLASGWYFTLTLEDPYGNLTGNWILVRLPNFPARVWADHYDGTSEAIGVIPGEKGAAFFPRLTTPDTGVIRYRIQKINYAGSATGCRQFPADRGASLEMLLVVLILFMFRITARKKAQPRKTR